MQLSRDAVTDFRRPPGEDPTVPAFFINLGGDMVPESSRTFCVKLLKEPSMGNWWMLRRTATEKAMAPHSSTLAWKIPWTEEPNRLQSMGLLRVGHD